VETYLKVRIFPDLVEQEFQYSVRLGLGHSDYTASETWRLRLHSDDKGGQGLEEIHLDLRRCS